ncbi:MAG: hypothetical protein XE04_0404 [Marinimicrobia bacterium 46_43]|nr:MAG: hypothetical protein XE04_0404 [Marinimicrobia bacterium 46_43]
MIIPILDNGSLTLNAWSLAGSILLVIFYCLWLFFTLFRSRKSRKLRIVFITIRTLALLLLLAMICDLRLDFTRWRNQAPQTLVLFDLSASMDSAWTRESLADFYQHPLTQRLEKETRIVRFGGGESGKKLRSWPRYDDFNAPVTDFESLVSSSLENLEHTPDQLVFLTDGQNVKGLDAKQITFPREITWLLVGVGDTVTLGRFTVLSWDLPHTAVAGDSARIRARISYEGEETVEGVFELFDHQQPLSESHPLVFEPASARNVSFDLVPEYWEKEHPEELPDLLLLGPGESSEKYAHVPTIQVRGCEEAERVEVSGFRVTNPLMLTHLHDRPALNREIWSRFPPVTAFPDGEGIPILEDEEKKAVVLAYQAENRHIIFNGCGFWRWAWAGYGTERVGAWNRLIGNIARFLMAPRQEWAWLELPRDPLYAGISAEIPVIKGPDVTPGMASGRIILTDSTGSLVWNSSLLTLDQPVTYVSLPGLDPGYYQATLDIFFQGEKAGTDSLKLPVSALNPERLVTGCNMKTLREWANEQNGHALHLSEWDKGEQFLDFDEEYTRHVIHVDFRRNLLWILLLLILLTSEWIIRKTAGWE